MAHFAKVENGIVTQVIVAEQDFIDSGAVGDPASWVQTSYNTIAGEYKLGKNDAEKAQKKLEGTDKDVKARDRKNFAGVGYIYSTEDDAFYPPQPFPSWKINKTTGQWEAQKKYPEDGQIYVWNEDLLDWELNN